MKKYKEIDCWVSSVLIVFFAMLSIINHSGRLNKTILTGYITVGGWQTISMLVHTAKGYFTRKNGVRNYYHWLVFLTLVTLPAGSGWLLQYLAPLMAVFYTWLCFDETFKRMKRPLSLLK